MSIKIDLLPGYVGLRRWFRRLLGVAAILLGTVGAVLFLLFYRDRQQLDKLNQDLANIEVNAAGAEAAQKKAEAAKADAAPLETTVRFFVDAGKTGAERAALLDLVKRYIYEDAVITSVDLSDGQTLKLAATVRTPEDYGNLLLKLRNGSVTNGGPLFASDPKSSSVIPSGLPGFPGPATTPNIRPVVILPTTQAQPVSFPIPVAINGVLLNKVLLPTEPGAAPAAATGTAPGPNGPAIGSAPASTPATAATPAK